MKVVLFSILFFINNIFVNAITYKDFFSDKERIEDTYITYDISNKQYYDYFNIIKRESDNEFVYSLDISTSLISQMYYFGLENNLHKIVNISEEKWNNIELITYYGYGYKRGDIDHSSINYYIATQYMIWQILYSNKIFFTHSYKGNIIKKYEKEIQSINELVKKHYLVPEFDEIDTDLIMGETLILSDKNNILSDYEIIVDNDNISIKKEENNLYITALKNGKTKLSLLKKFDLYKNVPIVYNAPSTKTLMSKGNLSSIIKTYDFNIDGASLELNLNVENKDLVTDAILNNFVYELSDEDNTYITFLKIDSSGKIKTDNILSINKKYILKDVTDSNGYVNNDKNIEIMFTKDKLYKKININKKIITKKININKFKKDNLINKLYYNLIKDENYVYDLYSKSNNSYYGSYKTYEDFIIPYGNWQFKTHDSDNLEFELNINNNETNNLFVIDSKIYNTINLMILDQFGDKIYNEKFLYKIKDIDNNNYICKDLNNKVDCIFSSDNGLIELSSNIEYGKYVIEIINDDNITDTINFIYDQNTIFNFNEEIGIIVFIEKSSDNNNADYIHFLDKGNLVLLFNESLYLNNMDIYIYDNVGSIIYKKNINGNESINLENIAFGTYYINLFSNDLEKFIYNNNLKVELNKQYLVYTLSNFMDQNDIVSFKVPNTFFNINYSFILIIIFSIILCVYVCYKKIK